MWKWTGNVNVNVVKEICPFGNQQSYRRPRACVSVFVYVVGQSDAAPAVVENGMRCSS